MGTSILLPGAILILWSMIMLLWMAFTRLPAMAKVKELKNAPPGGRGQDLEGVLSPNVQWKAHNYAHLMEQPTIFYPAIIMLHILGAATPVMIAFAWGYVILRIAHSIWQATINTVVPVRFGLFVLGSICLMVLTVNLVLISI